MSVALPARLHSNSPLAPGHPLGILCKASKAAQALALPTRIPGTCSGFCRIRACHTTSKIRCISHWRTRRFWNVALGGTAGAGGVLNSPPPSWTPAQGELVLKVDGKFKVRESVLFVVFRHCLRIWTFSRGKVPLLSPIIVLPSCWLR
jgi:hypothetical protein